MLHGERWGDVERAIDRIEQRFGRGGRDAGLADRARSHRTERDSQAFRCSDRPPYNRMTAALVRRLGRRPEEPACPSATHEQRILEEIETRLAEEDPVSSNRSGGPTSTRISRAGSASRRSAFVVGLLLMLLLFVVSAVDRRDRLRGDGGLGGADLPLPRAARPRSDARDAGRGPVVVHRRDRPDRRAVPPSRRPDDPRG